ncbi:MAG: hypothetical protein CSA49_00345 [Gammaproteobacteria bacterium]|nr:MAG: hypothetical protein CSA49_00345 [Gammaproteobacteria bacterium]
MSLQRKAFLAACTVFAVFFVTSVAFWMVQHEKDSTIELSLRRLMSQTFAVSVNNAEQNAAKLVKQVKLQWAEQQTLDTELLNSLAQRFQLDYVFVISDTGKLHWGYVNNSLKITSERKDALIKALYNPLKYVSKLKNGVAYFEQEPLYLLADILSGSDESGEGYKIVAGYYLASLFNQLENAYGFKALLVNDQRDHGDDVDQHLKGEVKLPGLISSPVSVWIKDERFQLPEFNSLLIIVLTAGASLAVFLWWLWRTHFILRIHRFIGQAHQINAEQAFQKRIKLTGDDELTELAGHYNSMLSTLEYSYNLMAKSNLITTELISKVQENTEPGSIGSESVGRKEEEELQDSLDMVKRLSKAVDQGFLELYFQPVFGTDHQTIIQLEALCRWLDADRGMIPPTDFIALAEKSGQMPSLTNYVILQACKSIQQFRSKVKPPFTVSVNLNLSQFMQPNLASLLSAALEKYGIQPFELEVEIKEHAVARDIDKSSEIISRLQGLGVGICIDDFGLSKFSLTYLQRLPVSKIKLSKSFVDRLERSPKEAAFIDGIARFANGLGIGVVAKGIQTEQQLYALEKIEMLAYQGFALARPMAKDQFLDWYQQ